MRPIWGRLIRHCLFVGITLAIVGYLLGKAFLIAHRIYSGSAYDPENERVLWQTPIVMAGLGILLSAGMDLLIAFVRRPVKVPVIDSPSNS
jgi:uncharacterized membrane protein YhhN